VIRSVFVILVALAATRLSGQTFNFRTYKEEEGLPQNYIYHISQHPGGRLLCSTGEALCAFNGHEFTVLSPAELTENFVSSHLVDRAGRIWIAHRNGGVSLLLNGKTIRFSSGPLADSPVCCIVQSNRATVIAASATSGLFRLDTSGHATAVSNSPRAITCVQSLSDESFLVGSAEGLYKVEVHGDKAVSVKIPGINSETPRQFSQAFHFPHAYWMLTQENAVYLLTVTSRSCVVRGRIDEKILGDQIATCIMGGSGSGLWIGVQGNGALRLSFGKRTPVSVVSVQTINAHNGLTSGQIQTIFEDREGGIWFGTFGDGLIQRPATRFVYYGARESLAGTNVTAICPISPEVLWIGSANGVSLYDRVSRSSETPAALRGLNDARITALCPGFSDDLWIGTSGQGLYIYDTVARKLRKSSGRLDPTTVNCIFREPGRMLVGSTQGLYVVNQLSNDTTLLGTNEGLLHNNVLHAFTDSQRRTWISSHGAPPYYIKEGTIVPFRNIRGLSSYNINSVCEDQNGDIWIATDGDGAFRYRGKEFSWYSTGNGLLSNFCAGIKVDRNRTLWITHKSGITEKSGSRDQFSRHTAKRGLLFNQNNINAIAEDPQRNIWFGTTAGLVFYQTRGRSTRDVKPTIEITSVRVNDKPYDPKSSIEVPYGEYELDIGFNSISLSDPTAIHYRYRISDADSAWTETDARSITFPKISDGKFRFQVMAHNRENGQYSAIAQFSLHVMPPVWKKVWFYVVLFIVLTVVTYVIVQIRTRRLRKTQLMLQLKVKQKTFLLQREKQAVETIKVELEHKNKDITDSINYAKRIQNSILPPDELFSELFGEDYFVLFKPKDIVSGDFYWAASLDHQIQGKNPLSIAAVVDCTGHGVPGAFLSIMANDFLRQSIVRTDVLLPHDILNFVNANVSSHLNQSSKTQIRDGMDIAIIAIDRPNMVLYFSGANNPIYISRQVGDTVDQVILTATKQAIGMVTEETVPFALREFRLMKGDCIYLFSDGYADQFGGPNNKKLSYKRFREILLACFELPMNQQKKCLEEEFEKWKDGSPQTDDVCVMGIRI
jgi:ligand-binding sensor domain-containing protein/serine phosphatase RsbU (regulator of sigma subunit)